MWCERKVGNKFKREKKDNNPNKFKIFNIVIRDH